MSSNTVTYLNDGGPRAAPMDLLAQSFADMSVENVEDRFSSPDARDTLDLGATSTIKWSASGSQFVDFRTVVLEFQFDIVQPAGAAAAVLAPLPIAGALDNVVFRAGNVDLYRSNTKAPLLGQLLYNISSSQDYVVSVQRAGGVLLDSGRGAYNTNGTNPSYGLRRQIGAGATTVPTFFYRAPLLELVPVLRDLAGKPLQGDFQLDLTRAADNNNVLYYGDAAVKTSVVTIRPRVWYELLTPGRGSLLSILRQRELPSITYGTELEVLNVQDKSGSGQTSYDWSFGGNGGFPTQVFVAVGTPTWGVPALQNRGVTAFTRSLLQNAGIQVQWQGATLRGYTDLSATGRDGNRAYWDLVKTLKRDGRTDTGLVLAYEPYSATDAAPSWTDRYPIHAFQVPTKGLALNDSANMTLRVTVDTNAAATVFIWYRSLASVEYTPAGNQYAMRGVPLVGAPLLESVASHDTQL